MKRKPETSKKARSAYGYKQHLRPTGKRMANKATRKVHKLQIAEEDTNIHAYEVDDTVRIEGYFLPGIPEQRIALGVIKERGKDHNTGDPIYFVSGSIGQGWFPERCLKKLNEDW